MKSTKIILTFISILLISQFTFAAVDACPGTSKQLSYSSSNVPAGQTCRPTAPAGFDTPAEPIINTSGSWTITVPDVSVGTKTFNLSCGSAPAVSSTDSLNVLDKNSQTCCVVSSGNTKEWRDGACLLPIGPITLTGGSCIIPAGASSCNNTITWTSANNPAPAVVDDFNGTVISNLASGSVSYSTPRGTRNVVLRNTSSASPILATTPISAECGAGHVFSGGVCVPIPVSVTLTAPNCTIAYNASSCNVTATWNHVSGLVPSSVSYSDDRYSPATIIAPSGSRLINITAPNTTVSTWVGGVSR
jgi:hypothetical protein